MATGDDMFTAVLLPVMSSKEEELLLQLKQRVQAVLKEEQVPDDLVLWRFLKARDNNVDKVSCDSLHCDIINDEIIRPGTCYYTHWHGENNIKLIDCWHGDHHRY